MNYIDNNRDFSFISSTQYSSVLKYIHIYHGFFLHAGSCGLGSGSVCYFFTIQEQLLCLRKHRHDTYKHIAAGIMYYKKKLYRRTTYPRCTVH